MMSCLPSAWYARSGVTSLTNSVSTVVGQIQLNRTPVTATFSGSYREQEEAMAVCKDLVCQFKTKGAMAVCKYLVCQFKTEGGYVSL